MGTCVVIAPSLELRKRTMEIVADEDGLVVVEMVVPVAAHPSAVVEAVTVDADGIMIVAAADETVAEEDEMDRRTP